MLTETYGLELMLPDSMVPSARRNGPQTETNRPEHGQVKDGGCRFLNTLKYLLLACSILENCSSPCSSLQV